MCGGLKSCCCCFSLRSGSLVAGSFFLALNSLNVASLVLNDFTLDIPYGVCFNKNITVTTEQCLEIRNGAGTAMLIAALMDLMHALTSLMLIFGIFRRSEVMMLPFLSMTVLQAFRMTIMTALSIMVYFVLKMSMLIMVNSSVFHLVVVVYFGAVVYNYYPKIMKSMFRDWYLELKKKKEAATLPHNIPIAWIDLDDNGKPSRAGSLITLEIAKDEERAKVCKDILCIVLPMAIVGAAWWAKEFIVHKYL